MKTLKLADLEIDLQILPQKAELLFRLREVASVELGLKGPFTLSGKVRGPYCTFSQTLAANYPIKTFAGSEQGRATIPDFCHWSATLPFLYELDLAVKREGQCIANLQDTLAVHWVRLQQGKLFQASKRWVPRLAQIRNEELGIEAEIKAWLAEIRQQELVLVLKAEEASDLFLRNCQISGVPVAIRCKSSQQAMAANWATFACVFLLLVDENPCDWDTKLLVATPDEKDLVPGVRRWSMRRGETVQPFPPRAEIVVREAIHHSPMAARAACDQLQAETAAVADWAAYLA